MYCWRGRIGLIAPSRGDTMIYEFYKVAPEGVTVIPYILNLSDINQDSLTAAFEAYGEAVRGLTKEQVDLVYIGGLAPMTVLGVDKYKELAASLREETDIPAITALEAEIGALQAMSVSRVSVLAPYTTEMVERLRTVLAAYGIEVAESEALGIRSAPEISMVGRNEVYRRLVALAGRNSDVDGVFMANTRMPSLFRLADVEERTGKVAISGSQSWIWATLGSLSIRPGPGDWGSLFSVTPEDLQRLSA